MNKNLYISLVLFLLIIAAITTLFLCQEYNWLFSFSIAAIFTISGNLIGQFVSKRVQVAKYILHRLGGWLFIAIICSVFCRFLIADIAIRNILIITINMFSALGIILYVLHSKETPAH